MIDGDYYYYSLCECGGKFLGCTMFSQYWEYHEEKVKARRIGESDLRPVIPLRYSFLKRTPPQTILAKSCWIMKLYVFLS